MCSCCIACLMPALLTPVPGTLPLGAEPMGAGLRSAVLATIPTRPADAARLAGPGPDGDTGLVRTALVAVIPAAALLGCHNCSCGTIVGRLYICALLFPTNQMATIVDAHKQQATPRDAEKPLTSRSIDIFPQLICMMGISLSLPVLNMIQMCATCDSPGDHRICNNM